MSYIEIHEIKGITLQSSGYGYMGKAICENIKASLTSAGATVSETVSTENSSRYDVTWVINNEWKIRLNFNSNTLYLNPFFGKDGAEGTDIGSGGVTFSSYTKFVHHYHILITDDFFTMCMSVPNNNGLGYSGQYNTTCAIAKAVDLNDVTHYVVTKVAYTTAAAYFDTWCVNNSSYGFLANPFYFYTDNGASNKYSLNSPSGEGADEYRIGFWIIQRTMTNNWTIKSLFKCVGVGTTKTISATNGDKYIAQGSYAILLEKGNNA